LLVANPDLFQSPFIRVL